MSWRYFCNMVSVVAKASDRLFWQTVIQDQFYATGTSLTSQELQLSPVQMRSASGPFISKELRCQPPLLTCFSKCLCTCCPFEWGETPCRHLQKYLIILLQTLIKTPLLSCLEKSARKTNPPKLAKWGCWCAMTPSYHVEQCCLFPGSTPPSHLPLISCFMFR